MFKYIRKGELVIKNEDLKRTILENGWNILLCKGIDAIRLRDLAMMSTCSIGTVYNLFKNLDEILLKLNVKSLNKMYYSLHEAMDRGLEQQESIDSIFYRLGIAYIRFGCSYPKIWKGIFENLSIDPLPDWYKKEVNHGIQLLKDKIEKAYSLDKNRVNIMVEFFWSSMHGMTAILINKKWNVFDEKVNEDYISKYIKQSIKGFIL